MRIKLILSTLLSSYLLLNITGCSYNDKTVGVSNNIDFNEEVLENKEETKKANKENAEELFYFNLKENINTIINSNGSLYDGKIGVSFLDLTQDIYVGYNDDELFIAGSTFKVPLAMLIYDLINDGIWSLDDIIYYDSSCYEEGMGVLLYMDKNRGFTVEELLKYMITESDNIATNMLLKNIGFYNSRTQLGNMIGEDLNPTENIFTPHQALLFLKKLYLNENNNPYYNDLLELMRNTTTHDRLDRDLPYEEVAHKIGNYGSAVNDIGIFLLDKPYIITVYTEGMVGTANDFISNLSNDIYYLYFNSNNS